MTPIYYTGGVCPPFVHEDIGGGGVCKMSTLVHSRGEGVKTGKNLVHVVVECPLVIVMTSSYRTNGERTNV